MANPGDDLIQLCEVATDAQVKVSAGPDTEEAWAPWLAAAEAFQRAVTVEAEATGEGRARLEQAAKKAVLHPEPAAE